MPSLPDAEQLLTLLAVAEAGNESAAALQLQLGQSSVSRRLAALQQLSEAPLTQRTAAGTRLTPAGDALLGPAREVRAALQAAAGLLDPALRVAAKLRCGITPHLAPRLAGSLSASAQANLELVEAPSSALLAALRRGELQAAITLTAPAGGEPGLRVVSLGEETIMLATQPGTAPGPVRWLLPAPPSAVGERAQLLLRRAGLAAAPRTLMPSPGAMRSAVLAGAGAGMVLRSEVSAEAAAGWLSLSKLPFGADEDARLEATLLLSDSLAADQAAALERLALEAMHA